MKKRKLFYPAVYFICVLIITSAMISCGKKEESTGEKDKKETKDTSTSSTNTTTTTSTGKGAAGREIFYMRSTENNIACADCHSDGTNSSNPETKYFSPVAGADKRPSTYHGKFKGDEVAKNAGGATVCWESYLRMKTPMTQDQITALNEFYESLEGADSSTEMVYETIALPERDKSKLKEVQKSIESLKGDPVKGEQTFKNACALCHGDNSKIKKVPHILEDFEGNVKSVVYNVRLGDGAMPFYKSNSLSDQDVADIAAYIMQKSGK